MKRSVVDLAALAVVHRWRLGMEEAALALASLEAVRRASAGGLRRVACADVERALAPEGRAARRAGFGGRGGEDGAERGRGSERGLLALLPVVV